jgi:hypothetical protein
MQIQISFKFGCAWNRLYPTLTDCTVIHFFALSPKIQTILDGTFSQNDKATDVVFLPRRRPSVPQTGFLSRFAGEMQQWEQ